MGRKGKIVNTTKDCSVVYLEDDYRCHYQVRPYKSRMHVPLKLADILYWKKLYSKPSAAGLRTTNMVNRFVPANWKDAQTLRVTSVAPHIEAVAYDTKGRRGPQVIQPNSTLAVQVIVQGSKEWLLTNLVKLFSAGAYNVLNELKAFCELNKLAYVPFGRALSKIRDEAQRKEAIKLFGPKARSAANMASKGTRLRGLSPDIGLKSQGMSQLLPASQLSHCRRLLHGPLTEAKEASNTAPKSQKACDIVKRLVVQTEAYESHRTSKKSGDTEPFRAKSSAPHTPQCSTGPQIKVNSTDSNRVRFADLEDVVGVMTNFADTDEGMFRDLSGQGGAQCGGLPLGSPSSPTKMTYANSDALEQLMFESSDQLVQRRKQNPPPFWPGIVWVDKLGV